MKGCVVAKVQKEKTKELLIPRPDIQVLRVTVKGTSPLIVHKWSTKAQRQIEDKQAKRAKKAREKRDPEAEFRAALYEIGKGKYGFPASAFKHAMIAACRFCQGVPMTFAKGAFFVMGDILLIKGSKPVMRTDIVRVPPRTGGADLRYRPEFAKWEIDLDIRYNAHLIEPDQIVNLLCIAGYSVGIGESRPSSPMKPGTNGMFEVKARGIKR